MTLNFPRTRLRLRPLTSALAVTLSISTPLVHAGNASSRIRSAAPQASVDDMSRSLSGYNYVITSGRNGVESVVVSGENGSGANAKIAADLNLAATSASATLSPEELSALAAAEVPGEMPTDIHFDEPRQGADAVRALGEKLPAVAAAHGMSAEKFRDILLKDSSSRIDRDARLFYVETPAAPEKGQAPAVAAALPNTAASAPLDLTKTFLLHSKPGSKRVIYLDFNGQTVTGTAWNRSYGKPTLVAPPFNVSGAADNFDDTDKTRIQGIWQRVAEDYAPFDVDVTTEEPTADNLLRTSSADQNYGTRAVITTGILGCGCGGVAYLGTFDSIGNSSYMPAWVFYDALGRGNEKFVAEAISHEVGHNLGLAHDGTASTGYYSGHGSGVTGWAPIMGVGYSKEVSQWSPGDYPGANNKEDDLVVMQGNGAALKIDDFGNTPTTAAALTLGASGVDQLGLIEQRADVDVFAFNTSGGALSLTVAPIGRGPNLDISASIVDATGRSYAAANPVDRLDATLTATLSAGTYYLRIDGTGKAATTTDPGYSDYGSIGPYRVTGSFAVGASSPSSPTPVTQVAPTAVASASPSSGVAPLTVGFSSSGSKDDGTLVGYLWEFGDGTASSTEANPQHVYSNAGSYTAKLTVTDDVGLKSSQSVTINASAPPAATSLRAGSIKLGFVSTAQGLKAQATVKVVNQAGQVIPNVQVTAKWTGIAAGTVVGSTDATGVVKLLSPAIKSSGTISFQVTGMVLKGFAYQSRLNVKPAAALSR